jgi:hypothetical protein
MSVRAARSIVVLGIAAAIAPAPAEASWPGLNGWLSFSSNRFGTALSGDVFAMPAFGLPQVQLTEVRPDDARSAWSPDGRRIAFKSRRNGNNELYVMNADGSDETRLTNSFRVSEGQPFLVAGRHAPAVPQDAGQPDRPERGHLADRRRPGEPQSAAGARAPRRRALSVLFAGRREDRLPWRPRPRRPQRRRGAVRHERGRDERRAAHEQRRLRPGTRVLAGRHEDRVHERARRLVRHLGQERRRQRRAPPHRRSVARRVAGLAAGAVRDRGHVACGDAGLARGAATSVVAAGARCAAAPRLARRWAERAPAGARPGRLRGFDCGDDVARDVAFVWRDPAVALPGT